MLTIIVKKYMYTLKLSKQRGLTLIELLIAMLIGTLLILGATSMFIANKRVYKEVDYQGRLAENIRFAMEMMTRDLRMAGFVGCAVQQEVFNRLNVLTGTAQDPRQLLSYLSKTSGGVQANAIEGSEAGGNWLPSGSTDAAAGGTAISSPDNRTATFGVMNPVTMLPNSDGFTVRFLEDTNTNLCVDMTSVNDNLNAQAQAGAQIPGGLFISGQVFAASDCEATNIFQLTADAPTTPFILQHAVGGGTPGNNVSTLSKQYTIPIAGDCDASPVDIHQFRARRYFVANDPDGNPGLYRQTFDVNSDMVPVNNTPMEFAERLIDGVENMQILYGEDTNGNRVPNAYQTAINVVNWANVVSVKIAVLFATPDEDFSAPLNPDTYTLLDVAGIDPTPAVDDRRRRKVVEATISLRNRQISL